MCKCTLICKVKHFALFKACFPFLCLLCYFKFDLRNYSLWGIRGKSGSSHISDFWHTVKSSRMKIDFFILQLLDHLIALSVEGNWVSPEVQIRAYALLLQWFPLLLAPSPYPLQQKMFHLGLQVKQLKIFAIHIKVRR